MKMEVNEGWCTYTIDRTPDGGAVRVTELRLTHIEHLRAFSRKLAMETLCKEVRVPTGVWGRFSAKLWHEAGFLPTYEGESWDLVYTPRYEQMSLEEVL